MNFCEIVLSLMTLLMALIFFWKYVGTLFMVMFLHQYHACLLHRHYWFWKKKLDMFDPLRLEK